MRAVLAVARPVVGSGQAFDCVRRIIGSDCAPNCAQHDYAGGCVRGVPPIDAPKAGNSKAGKRGQANAAKERVQGKRASVESNQRLSKSPGKCKLKCG